MHHPQIVQTLTICIQNPIINSVGSDHSDHIDRVGYMVRSNYTYASKLTSPVNQMITLGLDFDPLSLCYGGSGSNTAIVINTIPITYLYTISNESNQIKTKYEI